MTLSAPLQPRRPPWRVWAGLSVAVVALHALLLDVWTAPPAAAAAWRPPSLAVRLIEPTPARSAPPPPAATTTAAAAATAAKPAGAARPAAATPQREGIEATAAAQRALNVVASAPAARAVASAPAARAVASAPVAGAVASAAVAPVVPRAPLAAAPDGEAPPVYATRLPPPATLSYALTRHGAGLVTHGTADLDWQVSEGEYALTLHGQSASPALRFEQRSRGAVDAAGVAPERYTDRRRGGAVQAANFQRDKQLVSFSGAPLQWPLPAGAQDRASWMLQLAAVVEADAPRFAPGAELVLFVVGARGDAEPWRFTVQPPQDLELPAGVVRAARVLRREPRRRFDLRVEVWLDPQRHHLPVQLRLSSGAGDDVTEWRLLEAR